MIRKLPRVLITVLGLVLLLVPAQSPSAAPGVGRVDSTPDHVSPGSTNTLKLTFTACIAFAIRGPSKPPAPVSGVRTPSCSGVPCARRIAGAIAASARPPLAWMNRRRDFAFSSLIAVPPFVVASSNRSIRRGRCAGYRDPRRARRRLRRDDCGRPRGCMRGGRWSRPRAHFVRPSRSTCRPD